MLQLSSLFLFLSLSALHPVAQTQTDKHNGTIVGVISNEHATPVQNALIYLNKDSELIKVTTSDTLGRYKFSAVKADNYTINVSYVGYFKKEIKNVVVGSAKKELDITMKELRCTHGH